VRASIEAAKASLALMADQVPAMLTESLQDHLSRLLALDERILNIEQRFTEWRRGDEACRRISEIPDVGLLTATAAVAVMGNAQTFRSGREFAAYLGLVPKQSGSGGMVKLSGISKTRRRISAHFARSWRPIRHIEFKAPAGAAAKHVGATTHERPCRCVSEQSGAHYLDVARTRSNVSKSPVDARLKLRCS
jgi:hypothetical protein